MVLEAQLLEEERTERSEGCTVSLEGFVQLPPGLLLGRHRFFFAHQGCPQQLLLTHLQVPVTKSCRSTLSHQAFLSPEPRAAHLWLERKPKLDSP
jgi:hypothetical protein